MHGRDWHTAVTVEDSLHLLVVRNLIMSAPRMMACATPCWRPCANSAESNLRRGGNWMPCCASTPITLLNLPAPKISNCVATLTEAIQQLAINHDNCRAALFWCLQHDTELGLALAAQWVEFWMSNGHFVEGNTWLVGSRHSRLCRDGCHINPAGSDQLGASAWRVRAYFVCDEYGVA